MSKPMIEKGDTFPLFNYLDRKAGEFVKISLNDEMKGKIIKALNDNVDIPIISEKTEEKILVAIYDSVEEIVKAEILK